MIKSDPAALREIRVRSGHTTRSLARESGVSHPRISQLESGARTMRPTTALRLAKALGVEIEDIATIDPDTPDEVAS